MLISAAQLYLTIRDFVCARQNFQGMGDRTLIGFHKSACTKLYSPEIPCHHRNNFAYIGMEKDIQHGFSVCSVGFAIVRLPYAGSVFWRANGKSIAIMGCIGKFLADFIDKNFRAFF